MKELLKDMVILCSGTLLVLYSGIFMLQQCFYCCKDFSGLLLAIFK